MLVKLKYMVHFIATLSIFLTKQIVIICARYVLCPQNRRLFTLLRLYTQQIWVATETEATHIYVKLKFEIAPNISIYTKILKNFLREDLVKFHRPKMLNLLCLDECIHKT